MTLCNLGDFHAKHTGISAICNKHTGITFAIGLQMAGTGTQSYTKTVSSTIYGLDPIIAMSAVLDSANAEQGGVFREERAGRLRENKLTCHNPLDIMRTHGVDLTAVDLGHCLFFHVIQRLRDDFEE